MTKLALSGATKDAEKCFTALIIPDSNPILHQQSDSQLSFTLFTAVILFGGIFIGACTMGMFMWHRLDKVTVVQYKGSLMNLPAFLYKACERKKRDARSTASSTVRSPAASSGSGAAANQRPAGPSSASSSGPAAPSLASSSGPAGPSSAGGSQPAGPSSSAAASAGAAAGGRLSEPANALRSQPLVYHTVWGEIPLCYVSNGAARAFNPYIQLAVATKQEMRRGLESSDRWQGHHAT